MCDAYKRHLMDSVTNHTRKSTKTDVCIMSGDITGHLQPANVSWCKPFKQAYNNLYKELMATREKSFTARGNVCAPDIALSLKWVKGDWNSVTTEVIIMSF